MADVPSLLSLCTNAIACELISGGDHDLEALYELPSDLFQHLLMHLPPLALHNLQGGLSMNSSSDEVYEANCTKLKRKRARDHDFDEAWKVLFETRWPEDVSQLRLSCSGGNELDIRCKMASVHGFHWRQKYWEHHIQDCLDEAAETAFLPLFGGCVSEIHISENICKSIVFHGWTGSVHRFSKLSGHCQHFGLYARWLRLQNVLCVPEMCELLKDSNLQGLVFRSIKSKVHVDGVRMLLNQNRRTLLSLEFIHCNLSSFFISGLFDSLCIGNICKHNIQYFSVKYSIIFGCNTDVVQKGFSSFLLSARSLQMLVFCESHLGPNFARMIFDILLGYLPDLVTLELSDNYIAGCLSGDGYRSNSCLPLSSDKSIKSLRCLNLRGNNFHAKDVEDLKCVLALLPMLQRLDISDNPVGDDGIRFLTSYFTEASGRSLVELILENCNLTCVGVSALLSRLGAISCPLDTLSLADNDLGCDIVKPVAKFWATSHIKVLNIEEIGLGPSGFVELEKEMPKEVRLVDINVSKNRGGSEAAKFVARLILQATEIISVNASYNFIPDESLYAIAEAMRLSKGTLKRLDLTGNDQCIPIHTSLFKDFCEHGNSVVVFRSLPPVATPYDDDP